jgi:predicted 3-demethylubiquinone-9 3-methyltransferase (glyoxalase superfamily)
MTNKNSTENIVKKISTNLWFNNQAEEAAHFYVTVFSDIDEIITGKTTSGIKYITRYGEAGSKASGMPKGTVMTVIFRLREQEFVALNGGPQFKFSEAISFIVNCETQDEVNMFWKKLSADGEEGVCGWLKDKYGVSWQIVPTVLGKMLQSNDTARAERVMEALVKMKRIDIALLKEAWDGVEELEIA